MLSLFARTRCALVSGLLAAQALTFGSAHGTPSEERPAASMHDLRDHFAACFQPPQEAAGTRVTFYFAVNNKGRVVAQPRTAWFGFKGGADERLRRIAGFENDFARCLPLSMSPTLAATIPGKVYFLQYIVADTGGSSQVLLRPFGSHYFGGAAPAGAAPLSPEPGFAPQPEFPPLREPARVIRPPPVRTFRPFVGPLPQLLVRARSQARRDIRFGPPARR